MGMFEKFRDAMNANDADAFAALANDDYVFYSHLKGTTHTMDDLREMFSGEAGAEMKILELRKIYENDDIMVEHSIIDFPDGTREAVLSAHMLKNGKLQRTETGATPLPK